MSLANLKLQGNEHFKQNQFEEALSCYTKALDLSDKTTKAEDKAVLHKNKSACHLKLNNPEAAVLEASLGRWMLEIDDYPPAIVTRWCIVACVCRKGQLQWKGIVKNYRPNKNYFKFY